MVEDQVIAFIRNNGPSFPLEISKAIGYDSFVSRAVLLELINKGLVKKSKRAIGGSLVYYLDGQENDMRKRIFDDLGIPDKKVLKKLRDQGRVKLSELTPHERAFIKSLQDFIMIDKQGDDYLITYHNFKPRKEPEAPEIKPINLPTKEDKPEKKLFDPKPITGFEARVKEFLNNMGEVLSSKKVRSGSEYNLIVRVKNPFPQELFVKAKKKKSITESDLSVVYTEALKLKKPSLIVTTGKLSKKARKWKKENVGELVKVVQIQ
jgi:hypothetical protein